MSRREPAASPFRDLSNLSSLLTPRPNRKPAASALAFTLSETPLQGPTPTPLRRRKPVAGSGAPTRTPHHRRLRALEVDQSRSARRAESGRERALRTFAASASSWLSLLLRDPSACGCSPTTGSAAAPSQPCAAGKRDGLDGERPRGRSPKRRRGGDRGGERRKSMTPSMKAALRDSLREACSLDDVTERMERYMSKDACEEVLVMMCQICKNIDEGRLKMKAHCPLVTDLRLKEKATRIFLCYHPEWLRIGLHIVLGGDSLLQNGSGKRDKEIPFLKLILEKQIFAQIMTAKSFAHKVAEGLYKQGYNEALGNIDRAKVASALPLETGIDGLDGGTPLLFYHQDQIKSSRQIIQESLGEAMHGEGDLMMHLTTMGYKLSYQQSALSEYDFTIRSIFEDLQDGIILCRVVQLLLSDSSIILKVIAPPDTHKKKLHNCTMAIQSIKQAGVPLSDSDGITISPEDITTGDKELILSLLWNIFIHMQIPLLADKTSLARELARLQVPVTEQLMPENKSHISLLYDWVQVVCSRYGMGYETTSQFNRGAESLPGCQKELFTSHELDTITDVTSCPNSKMENLLADFLQDIPASGILTDDVLFDERSAIILLAFLSSHLTNEKRLGQLRNLVNTRFHYRSPSTKTSARSRSRGKNNMKDQPPQTENKDGSSADQDLAATIIQTQARCMIAKNKYCNRRKAIFILQGALRAWSAVIKKRNSSCLSTASTPWEAHGSGNRYFDLIIDRHRFVQMRKCAIMIQRALRIWIKGRKSHDNNEPFERHEFSEITISSPLEQFSGDDKIKALATPMQHYFDDTGCPDSPTPRQFSDKQRNTVISAIQLCKSNASSQFCEDETSRVTSDSKLVCENGMDCRNDISSRAFVQHEEPISTRTDFPICMEVVSAQRIQSAYRRFLHNRNLRVIAAIKIQSHWRGLSVRKCFTRKLQAIIAIQTSMKKIVYHRAFQQQRVAAKLIQRVVRGWLERKRMLVLRLQRWWRKFLLRQSARASVISIQSFIRGWLARKRLNRICCCISIIQRWWRKVLFLESRKQAVTVIQAHFRAYLVRKASKQEVAHIRSRLQKSSAQVDDGTATEYSKKCCETLVAAGAVDILLNQIHLLNRGIPDQEVLKQVLFTLRNIARYSNLKTVLINTPESVEIIFKELLRNKADGFFIASGILKNLCESKEGHETTRAQQHYVKRLRNLLQDLEKKVEVDKRNGRTGAVKETNLRRLGEAATLYHILTSESSDH
ncbi:hypothetical protein EJB05_12260, partial [Eragrostis curvula]